VKITPEFHETISQLVSLAFGKPTPARTPNRYRETSTDLPPTFRIPNVFERLDRAPVSLLIHFLLPSSESIWFQMQHA
jgi:hypothetical protein